MKNIWLSNSGEALCSNHHGHYASCILEESPNATEMFTPLAHWLLAELPDDHEINCEVCVPIVMTKDVIDA